MQPIDLQTLFSQMDKVGRNQAQQKEGLQIQATMQQVQSQKKAEEQVRSVNEAQNMGYGVTKVKDENAKQTPGQEKQKEEKDEDENKEAAKKTGYFRDPALGRNIDIHG